MSRRKGRVLAFQGLYAYDIGQIPLEDILNFSWTEKDSDIGKEDDELPEKSKDQIESETFAGMIINGTIENLSEIDKKISERLSQNWSFERINKISLAILRVSLYELLFQDDSKIGMVIDEAVSIAKQYGEDGSYKFINALLDKVAKEKK